MPTDITPVLRCIFYSHPWAAFNMDIKVQGDLQNKVYVEFAQTSQLATAVGQGGAGPRPGLQGALRYQAFSSSRKTSLFSFFSGRRKDPFLGVAAKFPGLPAPLILAPDSSVSPAAQVAALISALNASAQTTSQIDILVHYQEALEFSGIFPHVDQFLMLWDLADLPDKKLVSLSQELVSQNYITDELWGGFHLCHSKNRPVSDEPQREYYFRQILNEYLQ